MEKNRMERKRKRITCLALKEKCGWNGENLCRGKNTFSIFLGVTDISKSAFATKLYFGLGNYLTSLAQLLDKRIIVAMYSRIHRKVEANKITKYNKNILE